jgi:hypothetical protein
VTTAADRIVNMPRHAVAQVMSLALARGTLAVALVCVVSSIPIVYDTFIGRGLGDSVAVPIAILVAMTILVVVCGWRPSNVGRVAYLIIGGVLAVGYTVAVLTADPTINDNAAFVTNRIGYLLVLVVVLGAGPIAGVAWIVGGFATAMAATIVSSLVLGLSVDAGYAPLLALTVALSVFLSITFESRSRTRTVPDLTRLSEETRRLALENQFEHRAAAMVHDTLLGDLAAVVNSSGAIDERMRARLSADVATLADSSWLTDGSSFEPSVPVDGELRVALGALVAEFQWRGLSVTTSGNYESVVSISAEAAASLVAAIRACLENVLRHAHCESADLVFDSSSDLLTAMVVDSGVGFDPALVAYDRLGIRASIVRRIEEHGGTVKVWSRRGAGTSILITLPTLPTPPNPTTRTEQGGAHE